MARQSLLAGCSTRGVPLRIGSTVAVRFAEFGSRRVHPRRLIRTTEPLHFRTVTELLQRSSDPSDYLYLSDYEDSTLPAARVQAGKSDRQRALHRAPYTRADPHAGEQPLFRLSLCPTACSTSSPRTFRVTFHQAKKMKLIRCSRRSATSRCRRMLRRGDPFPGDADQTCTLVDALINTSLHRFPKPGLSAWAATCTGRERDHPVPLVICRYAARCRAGVAARVGAHGYCSGRQGCRICALLTLDERIDARP